MIKRLGDILKHGGKRGNSSGGKTNKKWKYIDPVDYEWVCKRRIR